MCPNPPTPDLLQAREQVFHVRGCAQVSALGDGLHQRAHCNLGTEVCPLKGMMSLRISFDTVLYHYWTGHEENFFLWFIKFASRKLRYRQ